MGDPKRIALVAADIVAHFEKRWEAMDGKAMIVCMSRRIAVDLYNAIIDLRPDRASAKDDDAEAEDDNPFRRMCAWCLRQRTSQRR